MASCWFLSKHRFSKRSLPVYCDDHIFIRALETIHKKIPFGTPNYCNQQTNYNVAKNMISSNWYTSNRWRSEIWKKTCVRAYVCGSARAKRLLVHHQRIKGRTNIAPSLHMNTLRWITVVWISKSMCNEYNVQKDVYKNEKKTKIKIIKKPAEKCAARTKSLN